MDAKELAEKLSLRRSRDRCKRKKSVQHLAGVPREISDLLNRHWYAFAEDLSKLPEVRWREAAVAVKREVLAITVNSEDKEKKYWAGITEAAAGYLNGYQDPEYIKDLPKLSLPVLPRNVNVPGIRNQRWFDAADTIGRDCVWRICGETTGGWEKWKTVRARYRERWHRVQTRFMNDDKLLLVSDNREYEPYSISAADIKEICLWKHSFPPNSPIWMERAFSRSTGCFGSRTSGRNQTTQED